MYQKFAIVDVETTGLYPDRDRILELAVILVDDFRIRSEHHFLLNPEIRLKPLITHLTGISDSDIAGMPLFSDVAMEVAELLADRVLVGHNIQFDYSFLKKEFGLIGMNFSARTICTRDFSEFIFPSLRSFSLKSICKKLKITNDRPHRAMPDARSTCSLFIELSRRSGNDFIDQLLNGNTGNTLIPVHLRKTVNEILPETTGVYYFIGTRNKPVYIGKAINIRQRVLSHFRGDGNSLKILAFAAGIKNIIFHETGSDTLAYFLEDHEIRHYWPSRNHAQKRNRIRFGIEGYIDQNGNNRLTITRSVRPRASYFTFYQYYLAAGFLRNLILKYELKGPLCSIPDLNTDIENNVHEINFQTMLQREVNAISVGIFFFPDQDPSLCGFIWLENGFYKGFGRVPAALKYEPAELLRNLTRRYSSATTESLISKIKESREPDLEFDLREFNQMPDRADHSFITFATA